MPHAGTTRHIPNNWNLLNKIREAKSSVEMGEGSVMEFGLIGKITSVAEVQEESGNISIDELPLVEKLISSCS